MRFVTPKAGGVRCSPLPRLWFGVGCFVAAVACVNQERQFLGSKPGPTSSNLLQDSFAPGTNGTQVPGASQETVTVEAPATGSGTQTPPATTSAVTSAGASDGSTSEPSGSCGNGQVEGDEECDDGALNDDERPNACRRDCVGAYCGDGVTDADEQCDGSQECSFDCKTVQCGNANVEEGEECDPPLLGSCTANCRSIRCGNSVIDDGEACEPPNAGRCNATCQIAACGDQQVGAGEDCDPPVVGACDSTCTAVVCGDGVVSEGEGCEPPGTASCDSLCHGVGCGNGAVDSNEECEPPGTSTCDVQCKTIACGNGRVDPGEECDPPVSGSCDDDCRSIICGNSRQDPGEDCDPPVSAQCTTSCQTIACGDGRVDPGEQCEPQGASDSACSSRCLLTNAGGARVLYTFDSSIEPWQFYSASPSTLEDGTQLTYDGQNGDVSPGVMRVEAPFTGANQKVEFQVTFGEPVDLRGRVLKARVRLGEGLSSDQLNPGGIKFFAKAGADFGYASGAWTYLDDSGWLDVTLVGDAPILVPNAFDASDVRQIGFELRTFTDTTQVSTALVYIDSVTY